MQLALVIYTIIFHVIPKHVRYLRDIDSNFNNEIDELGDNLQKNFKKNVQIGQLLILRLRFCDTLQSFIIIFQIFLILLKIGTN